MELGKYDKLIFEQFQQCPTEPARAHRIARMMAEGKITLGTTGTTASYDFGEFWRTRYESTEAALRAVEKRLAKASATNKRNVFRPDDRLLEWRYIVRLGLQSNLIRHDDQGRRITWRARRWAIEDFTSNLWDWRDVTPAVLRELTLRHVKNNGTLIDVDDLLVPQAERSNRAPPPRQDWTSVRDRLQSGARP